MDKILITGVAVWGKHGVFSFEREQPQPFTLDMEIWADISKSCISDNLSDTINYADIYNIIKNVVETQSFMLIERLSYVIIEKVFSYDMRIQKIRIRTVKNKAPLEGQVDGVGVEIEKSRDPAWSQDTYGKVSIEKSETAVNTKTEANGEYKAVLSLGSNIGDRKQNIQKALEILANSNCTILNKSKLYETTPVGYINQEKFYNAAILVKTLLNPFELLTKIREIENTLGRKKTIKWGPRTIDIDIIAYEGCIINTEKLTLPHKEYTQRTFVLKTLADIPEALEITGLNTEFIKKMACYTDNYGIKCIGSM
jgi:dihydroneopterin aldolase/2-amino-4-hydroxy-6-hydroxymethyldihydropteridine diphosphokinase